MKKPAFQERTVYAYNSDGTQHRAPIEVIRWLEAELADSKRSLEIAKQEEEESGYEFDYTIDRIQLSAQVDMLEYVKNHLENREG